MENVVGKSFRNETVVMDDKNYVNCEFVGCDIIYGGGDFSWMTTKFDDCRISFSGNAQKTVAFLQQFGIVPPPSANPEGQPIGFKRAGNVN